MSSMSLYLFNIPDLIHTCFYLGFKETILCELCCTFWAMCPSNGQDLLSINPVWWKPTNISLCCTSPLEADGTVQLCLRFPWTWREISCVRHAWELTGMEVHGTSLGWKRTSSSCIKTGLSWKMPWIAPVLLYRSSLHWKFWSTVCGQNLLMKYIMYICEWSTDAFSRNVPRRSLCKTSKTVLRCLCCHEKINVDIHGDEC